MESDSAVLYTERTTKSVDEACAKLEEVVPTHKFGILHVHDVRATLAEKGQELGRECRLYEVCNPVLARELMEKHMAVVTFLPCRIAVYEEKVPRDDGRNTVVTVMRPSSISALFDDSALSSSSEVAEEGLEAIIHDVAEA